MIFSSQLLHYNIVVAHAKIGEILSTKRWAIEYWQDTTGKNSIEQWLAQLTTEQFKSLAKELRLLELSGNALRLPHSRALGKGLFELRERRYGYRVYYGFHERQVILLLMAGNKATQKHDIKIAYKRLALLGKIKGSK